MTQSMNISIFSGYLGQAPKFFEATGKMKNGKISIDVAVDDSYQKQDGEGNWVTVQKTTWVRASSFEKRFIALAKRLNKGEFVQVQGKLTNYTKKVDEKNITELQVEITDLKPHNAKKSGNQGARSDGGNQQQQDGNGQLDDDIPF